MGQYKRDCLESSSVTVVTAYPDLFSVFPLTAVATSGGFDSTQRCLNPEYWTAKSCHPLASSMIVVVIVEFIPDVANYLNVAMQGVASGYKTRTRRYNLYTYL